MTDSANLPSMPAPLTAETRRPEHNIAGPFILRIAGLAALSDVERSALRGVEAHHRFYPAQTILCSEGETHSPQALLAGWACYRRRLSNGRQQIIRFLLPGDVIGSLLHSDQPSRAEAFALTAVSVGDVRPLNAMLAKTNHGLFGLVAAFERAEHAEAAGVIDQIMRLGRLSAYERLLHLMLEFHGRLGAVSQVLRDTFNVPVSQDVLADALGLSMVHVNRVLQQARRDGLLVMRQGQVRLLQPELMQERANWGQTTP